METATTTIVHVIPDAWKIVEILATIVAAGGALWFGWSQNQINRRMRALSDYVAINIVGFIVQDAGSAQPRPMIQVKNVGKLNVYLHKYEIGNATETYQQARLIDCGGDVSFTIGVPFRADQFGAHELPVKLYLTDEFGIKYLYTGSIEVSQSVQPVPNQLPIMPGTGTPQQERAAQQFVLQAGLGIRAWSYKTEKFDWKI